MESVQGKEFGLSNLDSILVRGSVACVASAGQMLS